MSKPKWKHKVHIGCGVSVVEKLDGSIWVEIRFRAHVFEVQLGADMFEWADMILQNDK